MPKKPYLLLRSMMKLTPKKILDRGKGCKVWKSKVENGKDRVGDFVRVDTIVLCRYIKYAVRFRFYRTGNAERNADRPVWVHCSCPYFLYYLEVAHYSHGSSSIINSNGKRPKITNPRMVPYLCKHLVRAAKTALLQKPKEPPPKPKRETKPRFKEETGYIRPTRTPQAPARAPQRSRFKEKPGTQPTRSPQPAVRAPQRGLRFKEQEGFQPKRVSTPQLSARVSIPAAAMPARTSAPSGIPSGGLAGSNMAVGGTGAALPGVGASTLNQRLAGNPGSNTGNSGAA